ncbi:MAG: dihydrolipoyllysine-residue succinyltransferase [Candidatus Schekmanbacteria bacterium]|nr:MAG: dihydrolipoyllysine-residue succinyltransferase [Candidatus Schekmanbacteria bacterium]
MPVPVIMPQLGESVVEGTIAKWFKKEGDKVVKDEPLLEINTDKVNIEVPCPADGILLKILVKEEETVAVGTKLGLIALEGEEAKVEETETEEERAGIKPAEILEEPTAAIEKAKKEKTEKRRYSPAVRRLAREYGIDPEEIQGTGAGGRVTRDDILAYVEKKAEGIVDEEILDLHPEFWAGVVKKVPLKEGEKEEEIVPLSAVRKAIARQMLRSKKEAPHVTTWDEADMTGWVNFLKKRRQAINEKYGIHLTYMPFIIKAVVLALKEFPVLNSSLVNDEIKVKKYYNIGVAVATERGLIVPVIHSADKKSVREIAKELEELARKARGDKLSLQDVHEGTFTITNAGGYGAIASTPIINYPEVAILGVHKIMEKPVVFEGEITKRWMMNLCLSFDHRVVDGVPAVKFLHRVKEYLEEPEMWIVEFV